MTSPQIIDCIQGEPEWYAVKAGLISTSNFSEVMAKGEGKMRRKRLLILAGERLTGTPEESFKSDEMNRGNAMELEARQSYALEYGVAVQQVGFIRNGDKGYSPDGLVGDNGLLEIKTRKASLQLELILADRVPPEHTAQIQGGLWVAEREWLDFVSYWPGLPLFVRRVPRDEAYIARLASEVARFNEELAELVEKIRAMDRPAEAA